MLSFWEQESFLNYDCIIIGSGIVGLSTAISLKEKSPGRSVLVLERGLFPAGASTRNAGFACFGSLTEMLSDLKQSGPEKILAVIQKRIRGLARLRERLGDTVMDYQPVGGYELIFEKELPAIEQVAQVNKLLEDLFPDGVYSCRPDLIKKFRFNPELVRTIIHNPHEGHLHTGKLMRALGHLAQGRGVEICTGAEVIAVEENKAGVSIYVNEPVRGRICFRAEQVAVCTNAFAATLLPDVTIVPGRGQVILTKPIPDLPWAGAFHFDKGFYYFRNIGSRVLFGGGRNLAFAEETSTAFEANTIILARLEQLLGEVILPEQSFEVEQQWSGIMGFTEDKQPAIRNISPRLVLGFACNGMGIALGSTAGEEIAELLLA